MADRITDERLRCTANLSFRLHDDEVRAIAAELLAARARIAKLEQEPPMTLVDFGYGLDLQGIRDDLKFLDDVRKQNQELRAEVERLREDGNTTAMDLADERDAARAEVERLRAELRAVATIAHEGGLAELGEGPPLTAIRRRTLCWWDRTGSRADAYARVRAAMKHKETNQ